MLFLLLLCFTIRLKFLLRIFKLIVFGLDLLYNVFLLLLSLKIFRTYLVNKLVESVHREGVVFEFGQLGQMMTESFYFDKDLPHSLLNRTLGLCFHDSLRVSNWDDLIITIKSSIALYTHVI